MRWNGKRKDAISNGLSLGVGFRWSFVVRFSPWRMCVAWKKKRFRKIWVVMWGFLEFLFAFDDDYWNSVYSIKFWIIFDKNWFLLFSGDFKSERFKICVWQVLRERFFFFFFLNCISAYQFAVKCYRFFPILAVLIFLGVERIQYY